jgi:hypothetical protein
VGGAQGAARPAAGSIRTVNRTRADAAAAYKKRIKPTRAAAVRMAPVDKPISSSRPNENLIVGKTWGQIQAAQSGAKRALDGGQITGKLQKPKATQGDRRLLAQKGMKGLKAEGLYGALDRLSTSKVRIQIKPTASAKPVAKPAQTKTVRKLAFGQSDFERRSQRTANIRNPVVKQNAQRLYGKILNLSSTPRQIKSMFKRAGKPKAAGRSALDRQRQRDHKAMLAAAPMLFR